MSPYLGSCVTKKPYKYRELHFDFGLENQIVVVALARPDTNGLQRSMHYLHQNNVGSIFGFECLPPFQPLANGLGMNYFARPIPDYTAPGKDSYEEIYEEILRQAKDNKKIAIHCGGGHGRTGCVLAALKLKELSAHDDFYDHDFSLTHTVNCFATFATAPASANVEGVVSKLRSTPENNQVIETVEQVRSLCDYEQYLRIEHQLQLVEAPGFRF